MKKLRVLIALGVVAPLLSAGSAGAQQQSASGEVRMTVHAHSGSNLLFPTQRLRYNFAPGDTFAYSSLRCAGNAPFNNIGLDFIPDYPGVDSARGTASVRHHAQGTITQVFGDRGIIEGRITSVLCSGPPPTAVETEHRIVTEYRVAYHRASNNELRFEGGFRFSPTESTGTFKDLQGGGRIQGFIVCLGALRDPTAPTCAQLGEYRDFVVFTGDPTLPAGRLQPGMTGVYYDPTVTIQPAAA